MICKPIIPIAESHNMVICPEKFNCPVRDCPHRCWHTRNRSCAEGCDRKGGVKGAVCKGSDK